MRIAVNTSILLTDQQEGYGDFLHQVLGRITRDHPQHEFIFIFNKQYDKDLAWPENVKSILINSKGNGPLSLKLWYDAKLPAVLKKHGASVFVSPEGICSLSTRVPQCLLIRDLGFLREPSSMKGPGRLYLKYYTPKFIRKAETIATFSEYASALLIKTYKIAADKITMVLPAPDEKLKIISDEDRQLIKDKYTDGKEYFLFAGFIQLQNNLMPLLKAYSLFKKRQLSNLKLMIAGTTGKGIANFKKSLKNYQFRSDIILLEGVSKEELEKIISSAYALIDLSETNKNQIRLLNSMVLDTPVIAHEELLIRTKDKEAVISVDPHDQTQIAEKMMLLYKDERLRTALIAKARKAVDEYHIEHSAQMLWELIRKTADAGGA